MAIQCRDSCLSMTIVPISKLQPQTLETYADFMFINSSHASHR